MMKTGWNASDWMKQFTSSSKLYILFFKSKPYILKAKVLDFESKTLNIKSKNLTFWKPTSYILTAKSLPLEPHCIFTPLELQCILVDMFKKECNLGCKHISQGKVWVSEKHTCIIPGIEK